MFLFLEVPIQIRCWRARNCFRESQRFGHATIWRSLGRKEIFATPNRPRLIPTGNGKGVLSGLS